MKKTLWIFIVFFVGLAVITCDNPVYEPVDRAGLTANLLADFLGYADAPTALVQDNILPSKKVLLVSKIPPLPSAAPKATDAGYAYYVKLKDLHDKIGKDYVNNIAIYWEVKSETDPKNKIAGITDGSWTTNASVGYPREIGFDTAPVTADGDADATVTLQATVWDTTKLVTGAVTAGPSSTANTPVIKPFTLTLKAK